MRAIGDIWHTVVTGASAGKIRQDVAVDFENLTEPVRADIAAGRTTGVGQFVTTMRAKVATRLVEGSVWLSVARTLDSELSTLLRCVQGAT